MSQKAWWFASLGAATIGLVGCGSASASTSTGATPAPTTVHQTMIIKTGKMLNKPGWPKYSNAFWKAKAGDTVVLTITSYDDGTAPLSTDSPYGKVLGTLNGTELVNGKSITAIPDSQISHTFTVPGLSLNLPIPAAATGKTVTVQATFEVPKAGTYNWQCEAPCGTTASGWGGPMMTPGWMQGSITVQSS